MKNFYTAMVLVAASFLTGYFIGAERMSSRMVDHINQIHQEYADNIRYFPMWIKDTITIEKPEIIWKTKTIYDTTQRFLYTRDTLIISDTVFVVEEKTMQPDDFYTTSRYNDSTLDATIEVYGTGVKGYTKIDSLVLDYTIMKQERQWNCGFWRRLFCRCDK